jgi:pimeloyl-ACP methyl ester carboxylesterase
MPKILFPALLFFLTAGSVAAQEIPYGNNPAAGKYFDVRGIKIYCEVYGTGKPLLMIHGNGGDISVFSKNIGYFSRHYKVIIPDSRAHGKSRDEGDSLSFEMMADDLAALLTSLHVDSSYVIGWSDGGINALLLAIRHPEKVLKLASTGANLWPDSTAILPSLWKNERKEFLRGKATPPATPAEKNQRKIFLLDWYQPNIPLTALHRIQCPSLIISGDHDVIRLAHTLLIFQHIKKAYLWVLPDSGHATLIDHSDEFNKKVDAFFSQPYHKG